MKWPPEIVFFKINLLWHLGKGHFHTSYFEENVRKTKGRSF